MDKDKPLHKKGVALRKLEDECLLFDEEQVRCHVVNRAAGFLFELCDGEHGLPDMVRKVRETYDVPEDVDLEKDVSRIIRNFSDLQLLAPVNVE